MHMRILFHLFTFSFLEHNLILYWRIVHKKLSPVVMLHRFKTPLFCQLTVPRLLPLKAHLKEIVWWFGTCASYEYLFCFLTRPYVVQQLQNNFCNLSPHFTELVNRFTQKKSNKYWILNLLYYPFTRVQLVYRQWIEWCMGVGTYKQNSYEKYYLCRCIFPTDCKIFKGKFPTIIIYSVVFSLLLTVSWTIKLSGLLLIIACTCASHETTCV